MSLTDILNEAVERVKGVQLAGVIGSDGLGVEMVLANDNLPHDREAAEIELAGLAATASSTATRLGVGNVHDIIVEADDLTYIASQITPGYFAVLGVTSNGNLGRARFAVRQMVNRLQSEL